MFCSPSNLIPINIEDSQQLISRSVVKWILPCIFEVLKFKLNLCFSGQGISLASKKFQIVSK